MRIPQPKLPSPTSSFPPDELAEIDECIELANELLLALSEDQDEVNLRSLQLSLREIRMQCLSVTVEWNEKPLEIVGFLIEAGLNFIILETNVKNLKVVPTERILSIHHADEQECFEPLNQELLYIDQCLRREITFNFGEVVSESPFLINLFFGIELHFFLESFVGCFVYVKTDQKQREIDGTLTYVDKRKVDIKNNDNEKQGVDFDELCYFEIERLAFAGLRLF